MALLVRITNKAYCLPIVVIYAVLCTARLAHFNMIAPTGNKPVKYYEGLPATYAALMFSVFYLLSYFIKENIFIIIYNAMAFIVAILFILKIKVPKPNLISSIFFIILGIVLTIVYLVV